MLDREAREWVDHRGSLWTRKSCIFRHCLWHFSSINCLRGSKGPCLGELAPLEGMRCLNLFQPTSRCVPVLFI